MTFGTLALLAPLAVGFHPAKKAACDTCPPAERPPQYLMAPLPGPGPMMPPIIPQNCPPGPPAPLLSVKFTGPDGLRVTAFPGSGAARMFPIGSVFGFRPGYLYRFELAGLPNRPNETLYPEVEVRGTLAPRRGMLYMEYPAAIHFTELDLAKAAAGGLITKVVYLEDPEKALPIRTTIDRPLEQQVDTFDDAVKAATSNGRLVMIVRLGNRVPTAEELDRMNISGTVLLPGETALGRPAHPPIIGWCGVPLFDPISGPKPPDEECLTDGGDTKNRLGIQAIGKLGGLDATDVAAEYTTGGKRTVTTSNRVCICAPRYAVQRVDLLPAGLKFAYQIEAGTQRFGSHLAKTHVPPLVVKLPVKPIGLETAIRPMAQVGREEPRLVVTSLGLKAAYSVSGVQVVKSFTETAEVTNLNEFVVTKSVEPTEGVKVGDEVTITIRYRNDTKSPISDLVISDSLSARLEYVLGSASADRPGNPTTQPNEVGSVVVRYEFPGELAPGQTGVVRFKARVR